MLLKSADDKSKRLALLQELQRSPAIDTFQRKWLHEELQRLKKGIQGERDSAHYLDHYFKDGENHVLLHDLRFVVDGEVTQIDHLILTRGTNMYLLETKNYACNLIINERGEFTAEYENSRFGIESPIEQSIRHEKVLCKLLQRLDLMGRVQKLPDIHHVVLIQPKATIERPPAKSFDTTNVIKADQFPSWHKRFAEKVGVGALFKTALNMRSLDTIKEWGEKLMRQHHPADLLALPDFMRPRETARPLPTAPTRVFSPAPALAFIPVPKPASAPAHSPAAAAVARPAPPAPVPVTAPRPTQAPAPRPVQHAAEKAPAKRLICAHCGVKISFAEGKFCWGNAKRFGGLAYCRAHQAPG